MNARPADASAAADRLRATALTVRVPGRLLIENLAFELANGEFLALLGPNGAGKSLLLQTLAGLRPPAAGAVLLGNEDLRSAPRRAVARQLGFVPQDSSAEYTGTVADYVQLGDFARRGALALPGGGHNIDAVDQTLARWRLAPLATTDLLRLSGGERRRAEFALLERQGAAIWLLDEPTNHLDPAQQADVVARLARHCESGGSVLASLHDPGLAGMTAQRVLLLFGDGRFLLGPAESLLTEARLTELYGTRLRAAPLPDGRRVFVTA